MLVRATHDERTNSMGMRYFDAVLLYDAGDGNLERVVIARGFASRTGAQREADTALAYIKRLVRAYIRKKGRP